MGQRRTFCKKFGIVKKITEQGGWGMTEPYKRKQGKRSVFRSAIFGTMAVLFSLTFLWPAAAARATTMTLFEDTFSPQQFGWSFFSPSAGFLGELNNNVNVADVTLTAQAPLTGAGTLEFDLLTFRSMDGVFNCCTDIMSFKANGQTAFSGLFGGAGSVGFLSNPSGAITFPPTLLGSDAGWRHHFSVPVVLVAGPNTFNWSYTHLQPLFDEAWGLDNVVLTGPGDDVPPTVNCDSADGTWHGENVSITCTASDNESGLFDPADANFTLSTHVLLNEEEGNAATDSRDVCDKAGNCTPAGPVTGNKIDRAQPEVDCQDADDLWHNTNVSLPCTAVDGGSGLVGPQQNALFFLTTQVQPGNETAAAPTSLRIVCDMVSNCAAAGPITGNKVDLKAPDIVIDSPVATRYFLHQPVAANYRCLDAGSGVLSQACAGTVSNGSNVDTSTVGMHDFSVNVTDKAGNAATKHLEYRVDYNICPLFDPNKIYKGGNIPIRVMPCDFGGVHQFAPDIAITAQTTTHTATSTDSPAQAMGGTNPDNLFRFDPDLGGYLYNLSSKLLSSGSYLLNFTVSGTPAAYSVPFQFR